jgi:hypothetical protein
MVTFTIGGAALSFIPGVDGVVSNLLTVGIGAAATLTWLLPLLPAILWTMGLIAWLIQVVECIIAAPLLVLVHLKASGDGLTVDEARYGLVYIAKIALMPLFMIGGLILATVLTYGGIDFLLAMFGLVFDALFLHGAHDNGFVADWLAGLTMLVVITFLSYVMVTTFYGLITGFPNSVMSFVGGGGRYGSEDQIGREAQQRHTQATVAIGSGVSAAGSSVGRLGGAAAGAALRPGSGAPPARPSGRSGSVHGRRDGGAPDAGDAGDVHGLDNAGRDRPAPR